MQEKEVFWPLIAWSQLLAGKLLHNHDAPNCILMQSLDAMRGHKLRSAYLVKQGNCSLNTAV